MLPRPDAVRATIVLPSLVVQTMRRLVDAVGPAIVLVGGWGVTCRLKMGYASTRPTEDVDVILRRQARPARAALEAVDAVQSDPRHPCRLAGLPLVVDLLAEAPDEALRPTGADESFADPDGLRFVVPPFGGLLARTAERVRLVDRDDASEAVAWLPLAGTLFAAKVANVTLEDRPRAKRASDGEDAVRLLEAFGTLALLEDLALTTPAERNELRRDLDLIGPGGLAGCTRDAGFEPDRARLSAAVTHLLAALG